MKQGVQTAAAEQGTDLADMMVGALDIRETTTSAATSYAILTGAEDKKMFTPASVLASTAKIFDGIQRAVVTTRTPDTNAARSEEHTSELQSLMRISYAVFCLKKNKKHIQYL